MPRTKEELNKARTKKSTWVKIDGKEVYVSDHAIWRWAERRYGFPSLEIVRGKLREHMATMPTAELLELNGFKLYGSTIKTYIPPVIPANILFKPAHQNGEAEKAIKSYQDANPDGASVKLAEYRAETSEARNNKISNRRVHALGKKHKVYEGWFWLVQSFKRFYDFVLSRNRFT